MEIDLASRSGITGRAVAAVGKVPKLLAALAEVRIEHFEWASSKLRDRADAQPLKDLAALLADAPKPLHWKRVEELFHLIRRHHDQSVRLTQIAGDLGQEFVRRHCPRRPRAELPRGRPA